MYIKNLGFIVVVVVVVVVLGFYAPPTTKVKTRRGIGLIASKRLEKPWVILMNPGLQCE